MRNLLKATLFVFPGMLGILWNPFSRRGIDKYTVDSAHLFAFNMRRGFSDKLHKQDIKRLFKDFKKYSKGKPKYLPEDGDPVDIFPMRGFFGLSIVYLGKEKWRAVFKETLTNAGRCEKKFLLLNLPPDLWDIDQFAGRYPSLNLYITDSTRIVNNKLLDKFVCCTEVFNEGFETEILPHLEDDECDGCGNFIGRLSPNGECPNCDWNIIGGDKLMKKLSSIYDKAVKAA